MEDFLKRKRAAILERWFELILKTYPVDAADFLRNRRDRFDNPVGFTISREIGNIYDEFIQDMNSEKLCASLDNILKIRSVQDFSPSSAVSIIYALKEAIREEYNDHPLDKLLEIESRIDELSLLAFDVYMKCRERIFEIRINEIKKGSFKLLERINSVESEPEH